MYTLIVGVTASVIFFGTSLRYAAEALTGNAPDIVVQRVIAGRPVFVPRNYIDLLQDIRGVRSMRNRLWGYYAHPFNGAIYTIMVPPLFPHTDGEIIVGEGVKRTWNPDPTADAGRLFFTTHLREGILLDVAASLETDTSIVSSDLILMSENTFRRVSGLPPGFVTDIVITVRNPREAGTIADKIVRIFPDALPILKQDIRRTYQAAFDWRSGIVLVQFCGAMLAFLIFAWEKMSGSGGEERNEIGLLKAVGWDTADILAVKFWEGIVISLSAFLAGTILAYIHVFRLRAPIFAPVLKGWSVLYPRFDLPPRFSEGDIAILFLMSVVPYTIATIIPVWHTATLPPDTALR